MYMYYTFQDFRIKLIYKYCVWQMVKIMYTEISEMFTNKLTHTLVEEHNMSNSFKLQLNMHMPYKLTVYTCKYFVRV